MKLFLRKDTGYYYIFYSRTKKESLKTKDKSLAIQIFKQIKEEVKDTKIIELEKIKKIRFSQFKKEYLEHRELLDIKPETIDNDELALKKFQEIIGDQQLRFIKRKEIDEFKSFLLKNGKKRTYINILLRTLRTAFNHALREGYISENPFTKKHKHDSVLLKVDDTLPRFLHIDEIKTLLEKIKNPQFLLAVNVYLYTGIRRSELIHLKRQDIDLRNGLIYIRQTKNRKDRAVPIHDNLRPYLEELHKGIGPLFPQWQSPDTISRLFHKYAEDAGIKARLHDLRHTFGSYLAMSGVDIKRIKELMGHKDLKTTEIYAKIRTEHLRQDINKLNFSGETK